MIEVRLEELVFYFGDGSGICLKMIIRVEKAFSDEPTKIREQLFHKVKVRGPERKNLKRVMVSDGICGE